MSKSEKRFLEMDMPARFKNGFSEGQLILNVRLGGEEILSDDEKAMIPDDCPFKGMLHIDATIRVGDMTEKDILGCSPQNYLNNGIVAALLEAIMMGLTDDRGTNFKYAVEAVENKADSAVNCTRMIDVLDGLEALSLANTETQGEA